MKDDKARHLIRDLPPAVETPDLPGAGGPRRERTAAERRKAPPGSRRTVDGTRGDRRR
jgi:hypothetical protein